jgi:hypothetical protein
VTCHPRELFAGGYIPKLDGVIETGGGEPRAVRREGDGVDAVGMGEGVEEFKLHHHAIYFLLSTFNSLLSPPWLRSERRYSQTNSFIG